MNGAVYLLFFSVLFVFVYCELEKAYSLGAGVDWAGDSGVQFHQMNSSMYKAVKRYHCSLQVYGSESYQLVYGTNAWRFRAQDVNLTLSYPQGLKNDYNYLITSMQVILYSDSKRIRGFITEGGIRQPTIRMTYLMKNVTELSYQFWVHGVPKHYLSKSDLLTSFDLCPT